MIKRRGAGKVRHIDIKHLFIQEKLRDGTINKIVKEPTADFVADLGTKALDEKTFAMVVRMVLEVGG